MTPSYYLCYGFECDEIITQLDAGWNLGNVVKYVYRAGHKTGDSTADIKKALSYLDREQEDVREKIIRVDRKKSVFDKTRALYKLMEKTMEHERYEVMLCIRDYVYQPNVTTLNDLRFALLEWLGEEALNDYD